MNGSTPNSAATGLNSTANPYCNNEMQRLIKAAIPAPLPLQHILLMYQAEVVRPLHSIASILESNDLQPLHAPLQPPLL